MVTDLGPIGEDSPVGKDVPTTVDVTVCDPGAVMGCASGTAQRICNTTGTGFIEQACAAGANSTAACTDGQCARPVCNVGFADCNSIAGDGCEADLQSEANCGACRNICVNGARCSAGMCVDPGVDAGPPRDTGVRDTGVRDTGVGFDGGGASATLLSGFGGPSGYGPADHCVSSSDDGAWSLSDGGSGSPISLGAALPLGVRLGASTFTSVFLNNNGNLSFGRENPAYTPTAFPSRTGIPIIAPWYGDVDTRGAGQPRQNVVCWAVDSARFIATWFNVGYYNVHNERMNTFQVILTAPSGGSAGDTDVEFRFNRCEWTTGDASGGVNGLGGSAANSGIDAGDGASGISLPGSGTMAVLNLCHSSNVGSAGVWRYRLRGGAVTSF